MKSELLDRRVRLNAAAFYYDYQDLQVFIYDTSSGDPGQSKLNAGSAQIYGLEAELTVKPTAQFDAFLSISTAQQRVPELLGRTRERLLGQPR